MHLLQTVVAMKEMDAFETHHSSLTVSISVEAEEAVKHLLRLISRNVPQEPCVVQICGKALRSLCWNIWCALLSTVVNKQ